MANEELKKQIEMLHQKMEQSEINAEEKDLVGHLMTEIVRVNSSGTHQADMPSLKETMEQQTTKFESSHPAIAGALRQVMATLSNMGI